ncbi:MAG: bifunctional folylpolyglutamate synthase/dihydrofolate synthase [Ruminococcaceae bacterium]|nr:bifunctional folylpolyglutamate synthase/dihydrofolate synthase [Oscillospiraceae bacterium]
MTYEEALSFIHSTEWQGSRPGLNRITELMEKLGNPEKTLNFVHVAGTNGKGSFCAMLDSVLRKAGYKTGLFTSPFIEFFEERIRYDGEMITKDELAETVSEVKDACLSMTDPPTEFEVLTAIGFVYFKKKNADIVVLECGMGGRLDSTNIIPSPLLSVITGIALDHVAFLGDTVEKIAYEKAGIIKPSRPVLYGGKDKAAKEVIKTTALERGCPYYEKDHSALTCGKISLKGSRFGYKKYKNLSLSLLGTYQPENAANVIEAVEILRGLGYKISDKNLRDGLSDTEWKGRFERLRDYPPVFFDGGHNEEGVTAAVRTVKTCFGKKKINVISGVLKDKDYEKIASKIGSISDTVYTVTPDSPRALDAKDYAEVFTKNGKKAVANETFDEAVNKAYTASLKKGTPILCVGSLYSYPDFKKALIAADKNGAIGKKAKEKRIAKLMIAAVCILTALFLALNLILESGVFSSLFGEEIKYREYPPLGEEYFCTPDWVENIFEDNEYIKKDRLIHYSSNNVTLHLEDDDDFAAAGPIALFFREYFNAVISGDHEAYNELLTDLYKNEYGEKAPFTMQKIYEIDVIDLNCVSYLNEGKANQITVYEFDVAYRIMDNNGTFRNNIMSDDKRAVRYFLYQYSSGEIKIFDIEEYKVMIK